MANVGTAAPGKVLIGTGSGASPTFTDIGTNSGLTNHGVLLGQGNSAFAATAVGATNTVLLGNTGADPSFGTVPNAALTNSTIGLTNSGGLTITGSPISLGGSGTVGFPWTDNSGTFTATANAGVFITAAATATLPASPSQGDRVSFVVDTTGSFVIQANTGQSIRIANAISSVAGTATNSLRGDSINLIYRSSGATWFADSSPCGLWLTA